MSANSPKKLKQRSKRCWTSEEDEQLVQLVQIHGTGNWSVIAEQLGNRTGKQCRERWHNHLNPDVKKGEWSQDEDRIILQMQAKLGNQWAKITKMLPGRTDNAVKNRWHAAMRAQTRVMKTSKDPQDKSIGDRSDSGASSPLSDESMVVENSSPAVDVKRSPTGQRKSPVLDFLLEPEARAAKRFPAVGDSALNSQQPAGRSVATMLPVQHKMHPQFSERVTIHPLMNPPVPPRAIPDAQYSTAMSPVDALIMAECGTPTAQDHPHTFLDRPLTPLDDPALEEWVALLDDHEAPVTDGDTGSDDSYSKRTRSSYTSSSFGEDELANFAWMGMDVDMCGTSYPPLISPRSGQFDYPCNKRNCSRDRTDPTDMAAVAQLLAADPEIAFFGNGSAFSPVAAPL